MANCEEIRKEIDTNLGVQAHLASLSDLHELIHLRMEYAREYASGECDVPLNSWVVLNGLLLLSGNGSVGASYYDDKPIVAPLRKAPTITTLKDFHRRYTRVKFGKILPNRIPLHDSKCPLCDKGWETLTCRQTVVKALIENVTFNTYAGKTLLEVLNHLESKSGKHFFTQDIRDCNNQRVPIGCGSIMAAGMNGQFQTIRHIHPECMLVRRQKAMRLMK